MLLGTVQKKANTQPTIRPNSLLIVDYRETQLSDRLNDLDADYYQNLKHLRKVANQAYNRFVNINKLHSVKENAKSI